MNLKNYKIDLRIILMLILSIAWMIMTFVWLKSHSKKDDDSSLRKLEQVLEQNSIQLKKTNRSIDSLQSILSSRPKPGQVITNINNTYVHEKDRVTNLPYDSAAMYLTNWIDSLRYTHKKEGVIKRRN